MAKDNNFYTKLTYEHKCIEDFGPEVISQEKTVWDLGIDELIEMFHTLMIGASYPESAFVSGLIGWINEYHPEYTISENTEESVF